MYDQSVLNPDSPLPLYHQLASELVAGIRAGHYAVGQAIPSEHALASHYGVGRPTVRQATDLLVRRGLLQRRRGSGTFVTEQLPGVDLFTLAGTLAAFEGSGLRLVVELLEAPRLVDSPEVMPGRRATRILRLGRVEGVPVLVERLWLDDEVFPGLHRLDLAAQPLSQLVEERYHRRPSGGTQRLSAQVVGGDDATLLGVKAGTALLVVERTLDFPSAPGALFSNLFCHTGRFELVQNLAPDGHTAFAQGHHLGACS